MQEPQAEKLFRYRWLIFWIMALSYVFVYFHRLCPAVVAVDLQKAFQASASSMGLLASAYFYPYAIMQFPAGLLSDSLGPRKTVTCFLMIAGAGSLAFGLAPSLQLAVGARVLVGLGVSIVFVSSVKILSQWFREREIAFMTALLVAMGGVGTLTAATPLALMTEWVGWRASFGAVGVVTLVLALLVWSFVRNRPEELRWPPLAEIDHLAAGTSTAPVVISVWEGAKRVFAERHFWPIAAWFLFIAGIFFGFGGLWSGPYFMHVYGMSRTETGNILAIAAVGLIVGGPLANILSEKMFHSRKKPLMFASVLLAAMLLFLSAFPVGLSRVTLYALMFIFAICGAAGVVIGITAAQELFPVEIAGTSVGAANLFPFLGGAIFQPMLGWILDAYGKNAAGAYPVEAYQTVLITLLAAAVLSLGSASLMKETFSRTIGRG